MELNQSMGLYQVPAEELDTFITNDLQPNQVFKMQISTAIHTIFLFLTQNCFRNSGSTMRVLKVVKVSDGDGVHRPCLSRYWGEWEGEGEQSRR